MSTEADMLASFQATIDNMARPCGAPALESLLFDPHVRDCLQGHGVTREAIGEDSVIKEIGHPAGREGGGGSAAADTKRDPSPASAASLSSFPR